jgi:dTDP-4-amino-4,6-dideoxygalactose transaminase
VAAGGCSAHHLFPVETVDGSPAEIADRLARRGVGVARHYPFICPDQPAVSGQGRVVGGDLPVARRLAERELSLPIHPYLRDDEIDVVIEACVDACG